MKRRLLSVVMTLVVLTTTVLTQAGCTTTPPPAPTDPGSAELTPQATETPEAATPSPTAEAPTPTHTPASTSVNPVAVLAPTSGPPGTQVQVVASGFQPNTAVQLGVGPADAEYDVVGTAQADTDGSVVVQVTIPEVAEAGQRWVVVVAVAGQPVRATSNLFEVSAQEVPPTVQVSPQSGTVGATIQIVGEGFPPEAPVEIGFGPPESEYDVIATTQSDADGTVRAQVQVPSFADPDAAWVFVLAASATMVKAVSPTFDVLAPPPPTATPTRSAGSQLMRVNIYLIALEDAGQSGKLIGCNDSVVPVVQEIEQTVAPLTATLNRLLSLQDQFYGESGLYNALYQSDLQIAGINIVQGIATISLSGTLVLGGVCDGPRVQAQIEEIAVQFSTVQQVNILLNGQPLETYLSGQ